MYDSFYEQYNYLEILAFNQKNDKLNVKIRNVDDGYVQDFTFDSFKNLMQQNNIQIIFADKCQEKLESVFLHLIKTDL